MTTVRPSPAAPLSSMPGHLLRRAQQRHTAIWLEEVGPEPTGPQYAVLGTVAARPGTDQRGVGAAASLDRTSTADVVERLVARGWLLRTRDASDARRDVLRTTTAGDDALARLGTAVRTVQARLVAGLTDAAADALDADLAVVADLDAAVRAGLPDAVRTTGHLLRRAQQEHARLFAEVVGRDVTGPQYAALRTIADEPGLGQQRLGERTGLDRSTTADVVRRLEERGLVVRHRDPADGRRRVLDLTDRAALALPPLTARVLEVQDALLGPLAAGRRAGFVERLRVVAAIAP